MLIDCRLSTLDQRKVVFVVDDDPSMLKGMRRLLKQNGFETLPFETAKALLDQQAITSAAYEAVIARAAATLTAKIQYAAMMPEDEEYGA